MLYIKVPYEEKDAAKALGARWNPERKQWYIPDKRDYPKFSRWILKQYEFCTILCDYFYVAEGKRQCFRCKQNTRVIGFGFENFWKFEENLEPDYRYGGISINSYDSFIPSKVLEFVQSKWNFKMRYSKFVEEEYMANCCEHCDVLQGDFFLFQEVDSPFFITSIEDAKNLTLYKIKLSEDLILPNTEFGWCSTDDLVKKFSPVIETNIII